MGGARRRMVGVVVVALATLIGAAVPAGAAGAAPRPATWGLPWPGWFGWPTSGGGAGTPAPATPAVPSEPTPTITEIPAGAGVHGFPYDAVPQTPAIPGAPAIDLSSVGYGEREFLMSGTTNTYSQRGTWGSDGVWNVSVAQQGVPYTTRLLVRYPTDPARFNGTVVFEWLNDTTGGDQDPVWAQVYSELISHGFAYVGVTAQTPGMADLRAWDPVRYGSLGDSNDGQSYDIFTQAAQVVRADSATLLGGLTPRYLVGTGDSQSAIRLDTYVDAFQPLFHAYDAFIAVGRTAAAAPLGNGLVATSPLPALIRTDNTAPFIQVNSQGDVGGLDAAAARQPDNAHLRTWELSGASHIDTHEATYEIETTYREQPSVPVPRCALGTPITGTGTALDGINQADNMPLFELEDAAVADLQRWLTTGTPAPSEPSALSSVPLFFGLLNLLPTNQYGLATNGIRLPEAQVPTEYYSPVNVAQGSSTSLNPLTVLQTLQDTLGLLATGSVPITDTAARDSGLCLLSGFFLPLPSTTLRQLYPTHAAYVARYTQAAQADEAAGFLTPADAAAAIAAAQASSIP